MNYVSNDEMLVYFAISILIASFTFLLGQYDFAVTYCVISILIAAGGALGLYRKEEPLRTA